MVLLGHESAQRRALLDHWGAALGHLAPERQAFFSQDGVTLSTFRPLEQGRVLVGAESA